MSETLDRMDGRRFLLHADVTNSMSMWSMAGMTAARVGVEREKNNIASLRICDCMCLGPIKHVVCLP